MGTPQLLLNFRDVRLPKPSSRYALEGVDDVRERNLRRVFDQEVDVIWLVVGLDQHTLEASTHFPPTISENHEDPLSDDLAAALRDEDQVGVEVVNDVSACTKVA